jgi:hypothetical protein
MNFREDKKSQSELRSQVIQEVTTQLENIRNGKKSMRPPEVVLAGRVLQNKLNQNRRLND